MDGLHLPATLHLSRSASLSGERSCTARLKASRSTVRVRSTVRAPLNRALSKLGILSRAQATDAIRAGRVRVDGRSVYDPAALVVPERVCVAVDGERRSRAPWRTIVLHKPLGVFTTRRSQPCGVSCQPTRWQSFGAAVTVRRKSRRESHLVVTLRTGRNREVRRVFEAVGHEVTCLKRVAFGGLELGALQPGEWRELTRAEVRATFPGASGDRRRLNAAAGA